MDQQKQIFITGDLMQDSSNTKGTNVVNLLIETNRMLSDKIDRVFEELTYLRHKLEGIDAGQIASMASRVAQLENHGVDREIRLRYLELHQNRWFGSKTVIVGLTTMIVTAVISWGLKTIIPVTPPDNKVIPTLDRRDEKQTAKPSILD
jgi:hypothetical protein